ncbi:dynamin family protein [Bacillus cereus group sp. BfR-BA-01380]|uniref:dynamin family protein n=1 Tax=Bacillus cereus group sp. BfR-BA-01380 TaxID=2920324 RepID=UPI001F562F86|nr:dynamin family protein [Bacillus cereus group sp. BfR-BA-01380]
MTKTLQTNSIQKLVCYYEEWQKKGDIEHSEKLLEVIRKYKEEQLMIAFCGHFSAGKSTMMNYLYKDQLLPTSPIPTSANVVKIEKGQNRVVVILKSGQKYEYDGMYTAEELKELCKNGDEVIGIHIYRTDAPLPEDVVLVDTPGIDSTDDAHQLATESTLHLADVIFYMMDYNHVQSEVNLQFVKELKQRNKTVYLVVNQIDKHKENELPFEVYQNSVAQSFLNWNIEVDGIFYTSLRMQNHSHNELGQLEQLLSSIVKEKSVYVKRGMEGEVSYLLQEHFSFLLSQYEKQLEPFQQELASMLSLQDVTAILEQLAEKEKHITNAETQMRDQYFSGLQNILDNAYLMPFEMRDLANQYLETKLTKFKVGLLFSKGKTEQEKQRRLEAFYETLQKTVETQLDFHMKEYVVSFLKQEELFTEELGKVIYDLNADFGPALLEATIKQGAGFTGDYLLRYTEDVANELKKRYRHEAQNILEKSLPLLHSKVQVDIQHIREEIAQYEAVKEAREIKLQYMQEYDHYQTYLQDIWHDRFSIPQSIDIEKALQQTKKVTNEKFQLQSQSEVAGELIDNESEPIMETKLNIAQIIDHVKGAEDVLQQIPALKHVQQEIMEKRKRVEAKQFTVALFGAFSAGKSSFANALLGEKVLPVSPNPTTATINQILPVTDEKPHGTVIVQFKSETALFEDLKAVYKLFYRDITSLEEALLQIDDVLQYPEPSGRQKTTFSFLRAVQHGYTEVKHRLGEQSRVTLAEFADYVANEEKSCFVEYMELYFDCELTRQGIALVDTPGADSVNARHTDVAFQYIKNADAILFVTYYNHVFSRADREFLIQLGRVKDTFALDKMFFLINAADLAQSEEELQTVKGYISDQLLQYGIRNPRLFAISSLFALEEKQGKDISKEAYGILQQSGLAQFEQSFTSFIMKDLMLVSVHSLYGALQNGYKLLANMIESAMQGNEEKEQKRQKYEAEREELLHMISSHSVLTEEKALENEVKELLYYVKQRLFLRYNDVFTEFINPASLRTQGNVKEKLQECMMELIAFLQHDLLQEMRATSLRLEKWINETMRHVQEGVAEQCVTRNEQLVIHTDVTYDYRVLMNENPFPTIEAIQFKKALSHFKSEKNFFEKNDKALMQEEMKQTLEPFVADYVTEEQHLFVNHYKQEWLHRWELVKTTIMQDIAQYYESLLFALLETIDVSVYEQRKEELEKQLLKIEHEVEGL